MHYCLKKTFVDINENIFVRNLSDYELSRCSLFLEETQLKFKILKEENRNLKLRDTMKYKSTFLKSL